MCKNQWDEAVVEYKKAIDLDPKFAPAHDNLGNALKARNHLDEAIAEYKKAIDLDPKLAPAHTDLGTALQAKNQLDEAIVEYKKAIDLDPKLAMPHNNLGNALRAKNRLEEAIGEYKKAIELDPRLLMAHTNLGNALCSRTNWKKPCRIQEGHRTRPQVRNGPLQPRRDLRAKNQLDEASADYRRVIDLQADCYAEANCNLAAILRSQGQLSASLDFYKRGHAVRQQS